LPVSAGSVKFRLNFHITITTGLRNIVAPADALKYTLRRRP
jgi:hypothetical protein